MRTRLVPAVVLLACRHARRVDDTRARVEGSVYLHERRGSGPLWQCSPGALPKLDGSALLCALGGQGLPSKDVPGIAQGRIRLT